MPKLKEGEKYLYIEVNFNRISASELLNALNNNKGKIYLAAFKNEKSKDNQPDYKGRGIAIWIKKKKTELKVSEEDI